jgi:hypothetical protein
MPEERLKENQSELNQRAKELLKEAKAERSPDYLYILQLMQWTLDQRNHGQAEEVHRILDDSVANLLGSPPKESLKWLLYDPDDPHQSPALQPHQLANLSPLEAGQLLLDLVNQNLVKLLPNYPPRSSV